MTTRASVIQMCSGPDVDKNLDSAERMLDLAVEEGAALAVLPECFAYLGPEDGKIPIAEELPSGGPILERCQRMAKERELELILGGFWERSDTSDKVRNACIHVEASGEVAAIYRKIHLFDVDLPDGTRLVESETVEPGDEVVVADTVCGKVGLSVCYDLRFPELYRQLVDQGARILAIPAAFTLTTGKDHWHVLLRARAIEAQSYVLAAAQGGHHYGKRRSYGHALIADPWGTVLAQCGEGDGVATARIDDELITRIRTNLPSLAHRRL